MTLNNGEPSKIGTLLCLPYPWAYMLHGWRHRPHHLELYFPHPHFQRVQQNDLCFLFKYYFLLWVRMTASLSTSSTPIWFWATKVSSQGDKAQLGISSLVVVSQSIALELVKLKTNSEALPQTLSEVLMSPLIWYLYLSLSLSLILCLHPLPIPFQFPCPSPCLCMSTCLLLGRIISLEVLSLGFTC